MRNLQQLIEQHREKQEKHAKALMSAYENKQPPPERMTSFPYPELEYDRKTDSYRFKEQMTISEEYRAALIDRWNDITGDYVMDRILGIPENDEQED